jgi:hypothetical protein
LKLFEKRRQAAALQDAGARSHLVQNPKSKVQSRDPEAATNVPAQVVDFSCKTMRIGVASTLVSRRLGRKPRVFGAFFTRKGVDFPPLTKKAWDFLKMQKENPQITPITRMDQELSATNGTGFTEEAALGGRQRRGRGGAARGGDLGLEFRPELWQV